MAAPKHTKEELQLLTAEALCMAALPTDEVEIPALGGKVKIQGFNGKTNRLAREEAEKYQKTSGSHYEDAYERSLVKFGLIEPKLTDDQLDLLWGEQFALVGRTIALAVLALNASGKAKDFSKVSG